ncbi:MAG: NMD3-related protein [Thermoplasmatales archaeon]|nr:NMD3-related protein [Thermoplasmatales archaeon]
MFCVECGREGKLYNNLCENCFRKKTVLANLPSDIDAVTCSCCNSLFLKKKWLDSKDIIKDAVSSAVKYHDDAEDCVLDVKPVYRDERNAGVTVNVRGVIFGLSFMEEHKAEVKIKNAVCPKCSKMLGKYHEAIIQVRASDRKLNEEEINTVLSVAEQMVKACDTFISNYEKMHGGIDLYIGSMSAGRQIAKSIADKYCAKYSESPKLVGRKNGKDVYRVTFAVRLPKYRTGDFVYVNGRVLMIKGMSKSMITGADLENHAEKLFKHDELKNAKILPNTTEDAVVVSGSENEIQILDPKTYKTVTLIKPKNFRAKETVRIMRYKDDVFLVPNAQVFFTKTNINTEYH